MVLNDFNKNTIKELYYVGDSFREIEMKTGISLATISKFIRDSIASGEVEKRTRRGTPTCKDGVRYNDDGTVYCNAMTNHNCIYGTSYGEKMCHYYLVKGLFHRRGCPPERCDKFVEGTPIDKKERGRFVFNEKGKGFQ